MAGLVKQNLWHGYFVIVFRTILGFHYSGCGNPDILYPGLVIANHIGSYLIPAYPAYKKYVVPELRAG